MVHYVWLSKETPGVYRKAFNAVWDFIEKLNNNLPKESINLVSQFPRLEGSKRRGKGATYQLMEKIYEDDIDALNEWKREYKSPDMSTECFIIHELCKRFDFRCAKMNVWENEGHPKKRKNMFIVEGDGTFNEKHMLRFFQYTLCDCKFIDFGKFLNLSKEKPDFSPPEQQGDYQKVLIDLINQEKFSKEDLLAMFQQVMGGQETSHAQ